MSGARIGQLWYLTARECEMSTVASTVTAACPPPAAD